MEIIKTQLDDLEIEMAVHRADSRAVLIMYPGADGSMDGYNEKYLKIANLIQSRNIATVVRLDNRYCIGKLPYSELMIVKLAHVIDYVIANAKEIAGRDDIDIYLSGVSLGAVAVTAVLADYPSIKKILLIAPADNIGLDLMEKAVGGYTGEICLVAGRDDEIEAYKTAERLYRASEKAQRRELRIVEDCDHRFTGRKNGMILSNAFIWAFSGTGGELASDGGLVLYD